MKRNEFIKTFGSICLTAGPVALLLQSCGSVYYATHTLEGSTIKLNRAEFLEIKKDQTVERSFVIVKDPSIPFPICVYKKGNEANALLMQCTHQGCEVNPNAYSLVCPCHGSEFDTHGKVLNPPAEEPLKAYSVTGDDENYYIHLT
ncbi:MAG: Rieske 2Fe-2S domain-containing protein [Cyclobacteriaceae bacterium]